MDHEEGLRESVNFKRNELRDKRSTASDSSNVEYSPVVLEDSGRQRSLDNIRSESVTSSFPTLKRSNSFSNLSLDPFAQAVKSVNDSLNNLSKYCERTADRTESCDDSLLNEVRIETARLYRDLSSGIDCLSPLLYPTYSTGTESIFDNLREVYNLTSNLSTFSSFLKNSREVSTFIERIRIVLRDISVSYLTNTHKHREPSCSMPNTNMIGSAPRSDVKQSDDVECVRDTSPAHSMDDKVVGCFSENRIYIKNISDFVDSVDAVLTYGNCWSKYIKSLYSLVSRNLSLEVDFYKSTKKLFENHETVADTFRDGPMPVHVHVYRETAKLYTSFVHSSNLTYLRLQTTEFLEPLQEQHRSFDAKRKESKEKWKAENDRMNVATVRLKNTEQTYYQRCGEYERAKKERIASEKILTGVLQENRDASAKLDRRKRIEAEAFIKKDETELMYRAKVVDYNFRLEALQNIKKEVLDDLRDLFIKMDNTLQILTTHYLSLMESAVESVMTKMGTVVNLNMEHEPGKSFQEFCDSFCECGVVEQNCDYEFKPFVYSNQETALSRTKKQFERIKKPFSGVSSVSTGASSFYVPQSTEMATLKRSSRTRSRSSEDVALDKAHQPSSTADKDLSIFATSPKAEHPVASELAVAPSDHALTALVYDHSTIRTCHSCDLPIDEEGFVCVLCQVKCHKACGKLLKLSCIQNKTASRLFRVPLCTFRAVPVIVTSIVAELNIHGLKEVGIYRKSGSQRMYKEYQERFEEDVNFDVSGLHPITLAGILKIFIRELTEPLLTSALYEVFMDITRLLPKDLSNLSETELLPFRHELRKLPRIHFDTCKVLMDHLNLVHKHSSANTMTANSIALIFSPTVFPPKNDIGPELVAQYAQFQALQVRFLQVLITYSGALFSDSGRSLEQSANSSLTGTPPSAERMNELGSSGEIRQSISSDDDCYNPVRHVIPL